MPVRRASLLCADGTLRPMRLAQGEARVELDLRRDLSYGLRLLGADGLQVDLPQTWQITVRDDAPPRLAVNLPRGTPELVAVDAVLPVACQAHDDIGLEALALELGIGTQAVHRRAIPLAEPTRTHRFTDRLDLGALAPEPGQTLTLCLWARDLGGQEARSEAVPLQIGTAQQAGDQARSQRARALLEHLRRAREALVTVGRGWSRAEQAYLPGDAAIHRGQLKLVAKQQERALARFAAVIDGLAALGVERPAEERSRLEHLGTELDWWRERVGGMLAQAHAAALSASGPAVVPAIERGAQLVTHAIDELDAISQRCALVVALAEARALAARVALAGDRLDVTVQVLRGQVAWAPMRGLPGLHASFHPGRAFVGAPVHTAAAVPRLRDLRVPGLGREDWCALYRGEIYIPEEGTWHFRCTTDDGVQLRIGGAALIGNEAWREQAPTSYRGSEAFTKGWHAIDLRYFQASGGSRLEVSMGREHDQLRPLGSDRLRHFTDTGTATPGLIAAMAQLPQRISDQALSRLQRDGALLTAIPRELARLGADTGSTRLDRLARRSADAGRSLDAWLADRAAGNPDAGDLERFAALAAALQPVPREAALILRTAMVERIPATPRQVTAIASETNIERIDGLCRALRAGGQGSGRHILGAEVDRLASGVARRVRAALDEAADPALSAVQRAAAARAAWVLAVRPAATLATMRRRLRHEPLAVAELRQGCDQLEDDMRRSRTALQELERAAMAEDADVAPAALRRTQMAAGASARELARRELRAALATLLPLAVARGAGRLADMQRFVDGALVLDDPAALADRLARWAEGGSGGVGAPASCEQMLDRTAALLGATDAGQRGLGDVLAQRLPVLVELEARRLARRGETQRARACAALSRGLARALSAAGSARERLAVLEAVRSGEPPSGPDQADETTQHLSRLAGSLRELARSGDPASRRALDRALVALAAPAAGPSDAVVAGGLAEELIAAAGRIEEQLAALDATSAEALSTLGRYRTGQQGVAQALAALAERVTRLRDLPTTDAPALSVLAALPATLTRLAERAEALAGADAVSGPADALAPARALARAIAHEAVEPVARAYRRAGAAQGVDAPELS
ncbi:MAG: PA14 domain-containing protein, partial [Planctomycetota bacterium]